MELVGVEEKADAEIAAAPEIAVAPEIAAAPEAAPMAVTGEPRVDETLRRLDELGELPVTEHPGVFERVHSQLVEVLGELRTGTDAEAARGGGPQH